MEFLTNLFKTDNIAIIILAIAVYILWQELKAVKKQVEKIQGEKTEMAEKIGKLEGKSSVEEKLISLLDGMDQKLDQLIEK
jgi:hypothetical protein